MATIRPLSFDYSNSLLPITGITQTQLDGMAPQLNAARREILEVDAGLWEGGGDVPAEKEPLDAGFLHLPARLLAEYGNDRDNSELHQILTTAKRLRETVDRVVVLGIGGSYMGARALMESCREPYYNELSRADRGGSPRIYFEGNNIDNDSSQGLLHLLGNGRPATGVDDRWGIVVISKSGGTLETAAAFRIFLRALKDSCGGDAEKMASLVTPVTGDSGKLFDLATALGCKEKFRVPDGVGGRFSILSAVGLLPAAIMGIDIIALLRGAAAMTERFATAAPGDNPVLDFTAVCRLMELNRGANIRLLSMWAKGLESVGLWYDQLLAESIGKAELGATPLTVVNTRDLHSRAQQHQEGRRDKMITNVILENWQTDPLAIGETGHNQDELDSMASRTLPELMSAAIEGTNQAYRDDNRPTADITLPASDASSIGQFLQMMMIATVLEGRLMGVNPYGQPGVEGYKQNMKRILG